VLMKLFFLHCVFLSVFLRLFHYVYLSFCLSLSFWLSIFIFWLSCFFAGYKKATCIQNFLKIQNLYSVLTCWSTTEVNKKHKKVNFLFSKKNFAKCFISIFFLIFGFEFSFNNPTKFRWIKKLKMFFEKNVIVLLYVSAQHGFK
jgi:hypothetical protein